VNLNLAVSVAKVDLQKAGSPELPPGLYGMSKLHQRRLPLLK